MMAAACCFLVSAPGSAAAMIIDGVFEPMELGHLPYRHKTFEDYVGAAGLKRLGKKKWRHRVADVVADLDGCAGARRYGARRWQCGACSTNCRARPARRQRECVQRRLPALGSTEA
jgi:hypothetical protein